MENKSPENFEIKLQEIPESVGFCCGDYRLGESSGMVFKKKCCKKYKRKGRHCRSCPKL